MKQSCTSTFRRSAAVGAAVAIVAASSAFGIGATAAVAAPTKTTTTTEAGTSPNTPAPTTTDPAPVTDEPASSAATTTESAAPTATPAPATPSATESAAPTPASPTATASPAAEQAAPAASTPVTWAEPSSPSAPITFTVTAGQPFSHTFKAQGGDGPLEYLFNSLSFDPSNDPNGWSWNEQTGVLTAAPKSSVDGPVRFEVTATDLHQTAVQYVEITIEPAAAVALTTTVTSTADGFTPAWEVTEDAIRPWSHGDLGAAVSAVPAKPGQSLWFASALFDRFGNPLDGRESSSVTELTSSDPGDVLTWDSERRQWRVTFTDAGRHELTVGAEGLSRTIPVDVADTPLAFTEQSSADSPLGLTATSGTPFSHRFAVSGATGPVEYSLAGADGGEVIGDGDFFRSEFSIDPSTGVLSGTPSPATSYDFEVIARSGSETTTAHVTLTVEPGAAVGVLVTATNGAEGPVWEIGPDGTVLEYTEDGLGAVQTRTVASVPGNQDIPLFLQAIAVDANGNRTTTPDSPHPTVTSDVATDRVSWLADQDTVQVDFPHASIHTLTVSVDGESTSFRVDVQPLTAPAVATTDHPTAGSLAYTGADESGPLAWALGLLASGAGLLVWRLRRRHG